MLFLKFRWKELDKLCWIYAHFVSAQGWTLRSLSQYTTWVVSTRNGLKNLFYFLKVIVSVRFVYLTGCSVQSKHWNHNIYRNGVEPPQAVWSVNSQWVTSQLSAICWCWGKRARVGAVWLWSWLLPTQLVNQNQLFANSHGQMRCLPTIHWDAIFLFLVRLFTAFSYEDSVFDLFAHVLTVYPHSSLQII